MEIDPDIREHIAADARLQREINHALQAVLDSSRPAGDVPHPITRILARTLAPSWAAHVSLQSEMLLPIIDARGDGDARLAAEHLRAGHANLSHRHATLAGELQQLLSRPAERNCNRLAGLELDLCAALTARRTHFQLSEQIADYLKDPFTPAERTLCTLWLATRPQPRFPLNLLLKSPVALRARTEKPPVGARLH